MKALHLSIAVFSLIALLMGTTNSVYAPCLVGVTDCGPPPGVYIVASPDSQFYEKNDTITIQGRVYVQNYTKPVTIQVIGPNNTKLQNFNTTVDNDIFDSKIVADFDTSGLYQLVYCIQDGCDRSYFKFVSEPYHMVINGKDFVIKYKSFADLVGMEADINSQALRVHISNATAQGLQFVIDIPRELIDSKGYDGKDASFRVWIGMHQPDKYMAPANFTEISSDDKSRTIAIDTPYEPVANAHGIWDFKIMGANVSSGPGVSSEPPLRLYNLGMPIDQIHCQNNLVLVMKSEDGSPACVKPDTASILIKRGWASSIIITPPTIQQTSGNNTLPDSFEPCNTPYTQSNNGIAVLYMPVNSIGKICVRYFNPNESKNASLTIFDASSYKTAKSITSWAEPSIIPTGNSTVRFSVKTGNQTGFYGLQIFCSGMPFAVGYDAKSNFTLNDFPWEKSPTVSCPMMTYQYKIDSLSGIGIGYIPYP